MINRIKNSFLKRVHKSLYKPGHYYSPIPNLAEIKKDESRIFNSASPDLIGVDLNDTGQKTLLMHFRNVINEANFSADKNHHRYFFGNDFFVESDAIYYQAMLSFFRPRRIIEVGSGFSSAVLFDTIEQKNLKVESIHFIEPYPARLNMLLTPEDKPHYVLHQKRVQDIEIDLFLTLGENDILFIDSSHISKIGSDVNFLMFDILPRLKPGVIVHIHDILYPFEYPKNWVYEGRFWNEAYLLKSFLTFNSAYKIMLFNSYLASCHRSYLNEIDNRLLSAGGSIWLQRTI